MTPFFINKFCEYLKVEKRYSDNTIVAYQKDLLSFFVFVSPLLMNEVSSKEVKNFIYHLKEQDLTNTSVNRKISALRTFYNWMLKNRHIDKSPLSKTTLLKKPKRIPEFVQEDDLSEDKVKSLFSGDSFESVRDLLIIEILYQTGVRLSELINIKTTDIQNLTVKVLGKRKKERIIPISEDLLMQIQHYLNYRNRLPKENSYLLVRENGKQLYAKFVYRKVHKYLSLLSNVEKRSPHVLRHSFATHLMNHGAGIEVIQNLLGHADLRATQIYTHSSLNQLKNVYEHAHPRGDKE